MKKMVKEKSIKIKKIKEQINAFNKINENLSEDLISLYKKIDLNKKVKLNSKEGKHIKKTYMESILYQQSALSAYLEGDTSGRNDVIETTDEFKDYLARNGLISQRQRNEEFTPGSGIISIKNKNRMDKEKQYDDISMKTIRNKTR
jgi:predicted transcriptional regulator